MNMQSILSERRTMYELIPVIEVWLIENGYSVNIIANRIDAQKGQFYITIFLENFPIGCTIKVMSNEDFFFENLKKHLSSKHLLTYKIPCRYCGKQIEQSNQQCPFCSGNLE